MGSGVPGPRLAGARRLSSPDRESPQVRNDSAGDADAPEGFSAREFDVRGHESRSDGLFAQEVGAEVFLVAVGKDGHHDGARVKTYPLHFDHEWHLSVDALGGLIDETSRAVVVVHPNNPTGSFLKRAEAESLSARCAGHGLAIIADEVFSDFALSVDNGARHPSFALDSPALSFTLGGLSKSCALPQMKVGWIAVSGPKALVDEALTRLEFIADTYLSVATPIQLALPRILEGKADLQAPIRSRLARNLDALRTAVAEHPELRLLPTEGGWSALIQCPATRTDEERALLALDAGVLVHPGHFFDFESGCYLVVSLLCPPDLFDAALPPLLAAAVR